jgi:hypothetical protein
VMLEGAVLSWIAGQLLNVIVSLVDDDIDEIALRYALAAALEQAGEQLSAAASDPQQRCRQLDALQTLGPVLFKD